MPMKEHSLNPKNKEAYKAWIELQHGSDRLAKQVLNASGLLVLRPLKLGV